MALCVKCSATGELGATCLEHPELRLADERSLKRYPEAHLLGHVIAGRFAVVKVIGVGGMGWVYAAIQEPLGRKVAIKVLKLDMADDPTVRERFLREARILGMLKHPNLVALHDFGELDVGKPDQLFMALEYVEGVQLGRVISRRKALSAERILRILEGVASGLGEIHKHDVVHRDIKPENIILVTNHVGEEMARLLDFGIARFDPGRAQLTQTGTTFGTPEYMSPEQAMAREDIGPPTDIYAVGIMLYFMLSGELPFDDKSALKIMLAQVNSPLPKIQLRPGIEVPQALIDLMERCLDKEPSRRPADGFALRQAVVEIQDNMSAAKRLKGPPEPEGWTQRFAKDKGNEKSTVPSMANIVPNPTPLGLEAASDEDGPSTALAVPTPRNADEATVHDAKTLMGQRVPHDYQPPPPEPEPEPEPPPPVDDEDTLLEIKNDLARSPGSSPTVQTTPLRSGHPRAVAIALGALGLILIGILVVVFSDSNTSSQDTEDAASTPDTQALPEAATQEPPPPTAGPPGPGTRKKGRLPSPAALTQLAQLNALHTALSNVQTSLPNERAQRQQEIEEDIEATLTALRSAGYNVRLEGERYVFAPPP